MSLITTILTSTENPTGLHEESEFDKSEGSVDNDNEYTTWVEYRVKGTDTIVHRSAHVTLKKPAVFLETAIGSIQ